MSTVFHVFANAALGKGLSGGDRIFIELSRRLSTKYLVFIHVWREGYTMCLKQHLKHGRNLNFFIINADELCKFGFVVCYFVRIILAIKDAFKLNIKDKESVVLYSASEFWMDSLPALVLKLRYPKITWIAGWFQTAPNPWRGFAEGGRVNTYKLSAFFYWLVQLPIKPVIKRFADFVLVNNEEEKKQFPKHDKDGKAIVILGAVDLEAIKKFKKLYPIPYTLYPKKYDACFQGRFHPQKGVVELIKIWKLVTNRMPNAKLAMIGDGPLMNDVKKEIDKLNLQKNVTLFGYVFDGPKKYRIFSQSKLVVHPAFYDSGGMASAEAMAFGLPCIGFNLSSYKSYYPRGMVKVKIGDLGGFASCVVELLNDMEKRINLGKEAKDMIQSNWSWEGRLDHILMSISKHEKDS